MNNQVFDEIEGKSFEGIWGFDIVIKDIFLCVCMFDTPSALLRLKAFMVWLSQNEVTEEQQKEIVDSFNLEEFSAEELLTEVRDSGLFSAKKIDERMLELLNEKELKIKELRNSLEDAKRYVPLHLRYKMLILYSC